MKLKSLVLGAAAGVFAVTGAQAADLPPAPEPVDYVRICDAFGSGFFFIPGTDSCLRLRGRLRTEVRIRHQDEDQPFFFEDSFGLRAVGQEPFFMRARGYWGWDHRTNTDIGLVRAFFRAFVDKDSGDGGGTPSLHMDFAFIQIGGLTLGFTDLIIEPVFGGYVLEHNYSTGGYEEETVIAQYVYSFGNGFSLGVVALDTTTGSFGTTLQSPTAFYGGQRMPAGGASLTYDGSIGTFRVAGILREIRPAAGVSSNHHFGWGVSASGEIGIPIGSETAFGFNAQYADGVVTWLHYDANAGAFGYPIFDFIPTPSGGSNTTTGWSATAGLTTQIAPRTTFNLTGGYTDIKQPNGAFVAGDVDFWDLQANVQYRLTSNVVITAEGQYREIDVTGFATSDAFSTVLRAQLDF